MKCRKCGQEINSRSDSLFTGKTLLIWLGVLVLALATLIVVGIMVIPTLLNQSADDSNKIEAKMYTQYLLDDGYNLNPVTYNNPIP